MMIMSSPDEEVLFPVQPWNDVRFSDTSGRIFSRADLFSYKLIFFLFAAGWSPPCRQFLTTLKRAYQQITAKNGDLSLQIVYVSHDETHNHFKQSFSDMPCWVAVGYQQVEQCREFFTQKNPPRFPP